MAVKSVHRDSKLKMVMTAGIDDNNKPIIKNKTIDHVRPETKNEVLFEIASVCASFQKHQLKNVLRLEEHELTEE